jgi:hypothetical protein
MTPEDIKKFTIGCKETLGDLEETPTTIECDWEEARIKINKETNEAKAYSDRKLVRWGDVEKIEIEREHKPTEKELRESLTKKAFLMKRLPTLKEWEEFKKWHLGKTYASLKVEFKDISPFLVEREGNILLIIHTIPKLAEVSDKYKKKYLEKVERAIKITKLKEVV